MRKRVWHTSPAGDAMSAAPGDFGCSRLKYQPELSSCRHRVLVHAPLGHVHCFPEKQPGNHGNIFDFATDAFIFLLHEE